MAKRVFKNKKLMRSILILAGLAIVGFFLWTTLFKRSSVFEGQTTGQAPQGPVERVNNAATDCVNGYNNENPGKQIDINTYSTCLMGKLNMTEPEFDAATNNARWDPNNHNQDKMIMGLQMHLSDKLAAQAAAPTQATTGPVTTVAPP